MRVKYNLNYANGVAVCSNFSDIEDFLVEDGWCHKGNYYFKECSREEYEHSLLKLNKIGNTEPYRNNSFWVVEEGGKEPTKRGEDLGWDIYAADLKTISKDDDFFNYVDGKYLVLQPGDIVCVPTHVKSAVSREWGFLIKERGSTGSIGLSVRCGVVDSGFKGEWKIFLNNTSNKEIRYPLKKAIAQAVVVYNHGNVGYHKWESERGEGMLGSSGK